MASISSAYLGKPAAMRALPAPRRGFEGTVNRGDALHTLLSGGSAVVRNLNPKRSFTLPYDVDAATADTILGFYQGLYGSGPWRFVDPTARNMLTLDASSCGARTAADDGWVGSGSTTLTRTTGAPAGCADSGVLQWGTLVASATLQPGAVANTADTTTAPVYLTTEAVTVSLYAKASSSSSGHTLQLAGVDPTGTAVLLSTTAALSLSTSFQRFTVTAAIGASSTAVYVIPRIILGGTVPTSISIAGAQVEYGDTVTNWQPGFGCPRVVITEGPGRAINAPGYRAHTLSLAEV